MKIEILGMGCPKCKMLYENTKKAVEEIGAHSSGGSYCVIVVAWDKEETDAAVGVMPIIAGAVVPLGEAGTRHAANSLRLTGHRACA